MLNGIKKQGFVMDKMHAIKNVEIKCLKCSSEYRIPVKYCGENILCDNCGVVFIVPTLEELQAAEDPETSNSHVETVSYQTVKINKLGMKEVDGTNLKTILENSNFITPKIKRKKLQKRKFSLKHR